MVMVVTSWPISELDRQDRTASDTELVPNKTFIYISAIASRKYPWWICLAIQLL